jgi:hypothetical protein
MVFEPLTELGTLASVVGKCAQYRSKQLQNLFQNGCTVQLKKPIGTLTDYRIVSVWYWAGQHKSNEHKKLTKAKGVRLVVVDDNAITMAICGMNDVQAKCSSMPMTEGRFGPSTQWDGDVCELMRT